MKKLIALALVLTMALSLFAGCAAKTDAPDSTSAPANETTAPADETTAPADTQEAPADSSTVSFEKKKIAVAFNSTNDDVLRTQEALKNSIGPALNLEFMFSEAITDAGALTTFIQNAYASGCEAVFTNSSGDIDQAAAVCNDLGMYFVGISSSGSQENSEMPYYASVTGASAEGYGESYAEAIRSIVADGEQHSVLILSGAACYGATSFIEGTAGSLRALQDVYGLTYEQDIQALATTSTQVDAANDKGVKITVVPGMQDLANMVSPLLQTGEYDVVVGTTDIYGSLSIAIDEVEKALGMNIHMVSRSGFTDTVKAAFNGKDSTGAPIMDAMVNVGLYEFVASVIVLRNCLDGYAENMRQDGKCSRIAGQRPLVVTSPEQYNALSADTIPYSFTSIEDMKNLCCKVNPSVTWKDIDAYGANLTADAIIANFS